MSTRATIRTNARARADQDSSDFPTDAQYNVYLDAAGKRVWYDLLAAGWPLDYSTKTITADGSQTYALGASGTVATIRGIYFVNGSDYFELRRMNEGKRAVLLSTSGQTNYAEFYDVRVNPSTGPVIELLPKPSSGTYSVDYLLEWPGFSGDSDTWYGPARSDELITLAAAAMGVRKEGSAREGEARALDAEYMQVLDKVVNMASWFDQRNAAQIRDMTTQHPRFAFDYPVAGAVPEF